MAYSSASNKETSSSFVSQRNTQPKGDDRQALSDEATTSESASAPLGDIFLLVAEEPNRWYVDGQYRFYRDSRMFNVKGVITRWVIDKRQVLLGSLHAVLKVHSLLSRHKFELIAQNLGFYNEEIVREFYASYVATLRGSIYR